MVVRERDGVLLSLVELLETGGVTMRDEYCCLVLLSPTIVRCRKDCYNGWSFVFTVPEMLHIASSLDLMAPYDRHKTFFLQQFVGRLPPEVNGNASVFVLNIVFVDVVE